jgi:two-component system, cell cycle sensor histidine kinase and response regulator CckA
VEDEDSLREAIVEHLRSYGYQVLAAADGVEALAILSQNAEIGIVISDLIMPRMGGRELTRLAAQKRPELRIVYMSGHADQAINLTAEDTGRAVFLQKPFEMSALFAAIVELHTPPHLPGNHGLFQVRNVSGETIH